eukprot:12637105-Alexandrium_andersonii.AAC.1
MAPAWGSSRQSLEAYVACRLARHASTRLAGMAAANAAAHRTGTLREHAWSAADSPWSSYALDQTRVQQ